MLSRSELKSGDKLSVIRTDGTHTEEMEVSEFAPAMASAIVADPESRTVLPPGLAIYGDGSDGDITIADGLHWPVDPADVEAWQPDTQYAAGSLVKNTGVGMPTIRVYRALNAGVSGSAEPFPLFAGGDQPAGMAMRGARVNDPSVEYFGGGTIVWEQETAIIDGWLEGPLFGDTVTLEPGVILNVHGWAIYARTALIIGAGAELRSSGFDSVGSVLNVFQRTWAFFEGPNTPVTTLMGRGVPGGGNGTAAQTRGAPMWGGGVGGFGGRGSGIDSENAPTVSPGNDTAALTLARRIPQLWFMNYEQGGSGQSIGSGGAVGQDDNTTKLGGAGGGAGSGFLACAKSLVNDGLITCRGGNGGDGEAGGDTGGGGGGSGGCCVLVYNSKNGSGTVEVNGGSGGQAGQADSVSFDVSAVNQGAKKFSVEGLHPLYFPAASSLVVAGSTLNDGTYTVVSAAWNNGTGKTEIVVAEAIPDATADGTITVDGGVSTDGGDGGPGDFVEFANA